MKIPAILILISCVMLFACQMSGQQACQGGVPPVDSALGNDDGVSLPDSVKITLWGGNFIKDFVFSLYPAKESSVELTESVKTKISKPYSLQLLRRISDIFIEHKPPVVIAKKSFATTVMGDFLHIEFVIYRNGKTIRDGFFVAKRQGQYEITYSEAFLELFDWLYRDAQRLYESKRKDNRQP